MNYSEAYRRTEAEFPHRTSWDYAFRPWKYENEEHQFRTAVINRWSQGYFAQQNYQEEAPSICERVQSWINSKNEYELRDIALLVVAIFFIAISCVMVGVFLAA